MEKLRTADSGSSHYQEIAKILYGFNNRKPSHYDMNIDDLISMLDSDNDTVIMAVLLNELKDSFYKFKQSKKNEQLVLNSLENIRKNSGKRLKNSDGEILELFEFIDEFNYIVVRTLTDEIEFILY